MRTILVMMALILGACSSSLGGDRAAISPEAGSGVSPDTIAAVVALQDALEAHFVIIDLCEQEETTEPCESPRQDVAFALAELETGAPDWRLVLQDLANVLRETCHPDTVVCARFTDFYPDTLLELEADAIAAVAEDAL